MRLVVLRLGLLEEHHPNRLAVWVAKALPRQVLIPFVLKLAEPMEEGVGNLNTLAGVQLLAEPVAVLADLLTMQI